MPKPTSAAGPSVNKSKIKATGPIHPKVEKKYIYIYIKGKGRKRETIVH